MRLHPGFWAAAKCTKTRTGVVSANQMSRKKTVPFLKGLRRSLMSGRTIYFTVLLFVVDPVRNARNPAKNPTWQCCWGEQSRTEDLIGGVNARA
ncbi:hypothetical protein AVEN_77310-1 [Araneus ventricosus]|uniref:Uncharacterized protein n=1 Tax=Araneus ventricosus TaxID=182803 RepID=A0A4Y2P557_ARAVE|nr:hypothetical protein AVEN_77310-1 [Araneus ventricosus]